ncbi:MAG: VOC family protein [Candidatus Dormibacteraeota bacterium]|nr:VOC family protein [Candidatus Dormibacteraeota bacterium]MBO0704275.1 VOC family protein [Candidatus Dormibacteraeota bacterium]MBO0760473.1 VOC family protein [Candidatus Dormibacteraeota bacterium]
MTRATSVPTGYQSVSPYLIVADVPALLDFLTAAFDAEELNRNPRPDGTIAHAEARVGDSVVMMGQAAGEWTPVPTSLFLWVDDVDGTYERALAAGATSLGAPEDKAYGDRMAGVQDPMGNRWWLGTPLEQR